MGSATGGDPRDFELGGQLYRLRHFGTARVDLEQDFSCPRAELVTAVLQTCLSQTEASGPELDPWDWELGWRLEALLWIAGLEVYEPKFHCQDQGCDGETEIVMTREELVEAQRSANRNAVVEVVSKGESLRLRRPRGSDLRRWASQAEVHSQMARILADLRLEDQASENLETFLSEEGRDAINRAMTASDPLVNLRVSTNCSNCGRELSADLDLEGELLRRLAHKQRELQLTIHRLAKVYHWSEDEILSIPTRRRRRYLELIEQENG